MPPQHFNAPDNADDAIEIVKALATHLDQRLDLMQTHFDERFDRIESLSGGQERRIAVLEDKVRQVATKIGLTFTQ